jgi:hypothetical protein
MTLSYMEFRKRDIWVQTETPSIYDPTTRRNTPPKGYVVSFRYSPEPAEIAGEYLRGADGSLRWFEDEQEAIGAAFEEAVRRIEQ